MSFKQFLESRNTETISYTEVKEKGIVGWNRNTVQTILEDLSN